MLLAIGLKEIVFIILGYMLIRFILGVRKARRTVLNMKEQMENEIRNAQRAAEQRPEGEIRIDKGVHKNPKSNPDDGDYVDFEEVD